MVHGLRLPTNQFQIEDEDGVDDRHEQEREERGDGETADLRVAERLPEWAAVRCEWEEREDRCRDRDEHRTQAQDAGIEERLSTTPLPRVSLR